MITRAAEKEYEAKLDSDGVIELRPQAMTDVSSIPEETLHMIDEAMENLKAEDASGPVDLGKEYPE